MFHFTHAFTPIETNNHLWKTTICSTRLRQIVFVFLFWVHEWIVSWRLWCYNHYPLDFISSSLDIVVWQCTIKHRWCGEGIIVLTLTRWRTILWHTYANRHSYDNLIITIILLTKSPFKIIKMISNGRMLIFKLIEAICVI